MSKKRIDLTGQRFGKLTAISYVENDRHGQALWLCKCDCGNEKIVGCSKLRSGDISSCGCAQHVMTIEIRKNISIAKTTHGLSNTRIYYIYNNMIRRCYDPNSTKYSNYGARGISVCDEWKNDIQAFFNWAKNSGYSEDLTIDRIDVNGNYCPENCKWSTPKEQANNRTSNHIVCCNSETHTVSEWSDITGTPSKTIYARLKNKWSVEDALFKPLSNY